MRSGPDRFAREREELEDVEKGVARSPRTRRRRISMTLSGSSMWVLRNRSRSDLVPTGELMAQPSKTVRIVGALETKTISFIGGRKGEFERTGSGSTTVIFFSQPCAASPATQNMRPKMLLSHSWMSPLLTHFGSDSGLTVSSFTRRVKDAGYASSRENGGKVGSVSYETLVMACKAEYDLVTSDKFST